MSTTKSSDPFELALPYDGPEVVERLTALAARMTALNLSTDETKVMKQASHEWAEDMLYAARHYAEDEEEEGIDLLSDELFDGDDLVEFFEGYFYRAFFAGAIWQQERQS